MNRMRTRLTVSLYAVGCLSGAAFAGVPGAAPLLATVVRAANSGTPQTVTGVTVGNKTLGWIPGAEGLTIRKFFQPDPWKAATLEPPFTNGASLAVFHTWHAPESDGDHIHPLLKSAAGLKIGPEIGERDTQGYRITHHDLSIRITPQAKRADIRDSFTIVPLKNPQRIAFLRISSDFKVASLRSAGKAIPFRQAGGIIAVPVPKGKSVTLAMAYSGVVAHKMMSSITPDLAVLSAYYYPTLGRLPSTADVTAVVPRGWSVVTQGELVRSASDAKSATFTFHNPLPVNYFTLDAAPYQITRRQVAGHTLYAYLLKSRPGFADSLLDSVAQALPYFEKRFGPYPYTRYSVVDGGAIMGFVALEGYSMASYGTLTLTPNVLAHELAHTWWGGVVPNTYLRSWWNESFARYSDEAFSRMRNNITERHPTDRPWWPPLHAVEADSLRTARDESSVNAIAYEKGRVVLRLLEDQVTQPAFDKCIREFVKERRSGLDTDWPDFQRAVERVTGRKWGWFFDQWVNRKGWPRIEFSNVRARLNEDGQWEVSGRVSQPLDVYMCEVKLRMSGAFDKNGTKTDSAFPMPDASLVLTDNDRPFQFTMDHLPQKLQLDPDLDVPRCMGVDDIALFDKFGNTVMQHSREEAEPSPFGGM
ncbi:MAG TPA: M1 family aminopeptidase [Armatimonadota bacterium]|jgi:hypothetical protein